jgi:DNA (cytosine-5)-methyltransferase 1
MPHIPLIDIFAGPGGLGEGFASYQDQRGRHPFRIRLSIEKDAFAHQTLELRAFYRQFDPPEVPEDFYRHLREELTREELFLRHAGPARRARLEAWHHELGRASSELVRERVRAALGDSEPWVLVGGPPCQAYSLAGRSRNKGVSGYDPCKDQRQTLYVEYLQILADHAPPVFVMENVKGLLSASLENRRMFDRIREDLADPARALRREGRRSARSSIRYSILPLAPQEGIPPGLGLGTDATSPSDFLVRAERYGIPQARHRVILLGIREDLRPRVPRLLEEGRLVTIQEAIADLPRLRSGVSGEPDSPQTWRSVLLSAPKERWFRNGRGGVAPEVLATINRTLNAIAIPVSDRGGNFLRAPSRPLFEPSWYGDQRIRGVLNHSTRAHMREDLFRYLYAASYAEAFGRSPSLDAFPPGLRPDHANVSRALKGGYFGDRFRVQVRDRPSTTITSHISKDGHYYIHPDPTQCRSLTVREAARIQTFPDNYLFCGPRTSQYIQVGNAVPPLLARQIARVVSALL